MNLFRTPYEDYYEFYPDREYSNLELIRILKEEHLTLEDGNGAILVLIQRLNERIEVLEAKIE